MEIKWLIIAFAVFGELRFYHVFHHSDIPLLNGNQELMNCMSVLSFIVGHLIIWAVFNKNLLLFSVIFY